MTPFVKMQAIGNDFIVVPESALGTLAPLTQALCDRRFGIGADGLLTVAPHPEGLTFRIFNADGSEDTMCGNGLRCVVRWAVDTGQAPTTGVAHTQVGPIPYTILADTVSLTLPPPRFWEQSLPQTQTVDTGSVHTVLWPDSLPEDTRFLRESAALEAHPHFPERTSVIWTTLVAPNHLKIRIWERGVGETLGCGTGACAAAVVAVATYRCHPTAPVTVTSPGGSLTVQWSGHPDSSVQLTGPATVVFQGQISASRSARRAR